MKVNTLKHYIVHSHIQLYIHVHVFAQKFPNSRKLCLHVLKLVYSENTLKTHLYIKFKISPATLCARINWPVFHSEMTLVHFVAQYIALSSPESFIGILWVQNRNWDILNLISEMKLLVYQLQYKPLYIQENSYLTKMKIKSPTLV